MNKIYNIVKKGEEKLPEYLSRSTKYFKYPTISLLLADYDADILMPKHLVMKTPQDFYNKILLNILPRGFEKVECLIGFGSSYGIKDKTGKLLNKGNSFHAYWPNSNISEKTIDNLIEYIKRACIKHNYYYLKIHKNGSTSMRYAIDLSVLKSALSRLCFEAAPTCKNELYQDRPVNCIWNTNSQEILDLTKIYYEHLPRWDEIYKQLKINNQDLIQETKEAYKLSKINELTSQGLTQKVATDIVTKQIEESILSVKTIVETN